MGLLRWTPEAFWAATPSELDAAVSGWNEAHKVHPSEPDGSVHKMKAWFGAKAKGRI